MKHLPKLNTIFKDAAVAIAAFGAIFGAGAGTAAVATVTAPAASASLDVELYEGPNSGYNNVHWDRGAPFWTKTACSARDGCFSSNYPGWPPDNCWDFAPNYFSNNPNIQVPPPDVPVYTSPYGSIPFGSL